MTTPFPLRGVIGLIAHSFQELDLAQEKGLQCVEIRADLLLDAGLSLDQVMAVVSQAKRVGLSCLFTLRHPSHGGKFPGDEQTRARISEQALTAGADIVDLEWRSEAARLLLKKNRPLILSHHDFSSMPTPIELERITQQMLSEHASAIKLVPTATALADSARMLDWVADAGGNSVRIGFAMGAAGACSRILTLAFGAPITYASFGEPVAPGQVAIDDLLQGYRVQQLNSTTRVIPLVVAEDAVGLARSINQNLYADGRDCVSVPVELKMLDELLPYVDALRIDRIVADHHFLNAAQELLGPDKIIGDDTSDAGFIVLSFDHAHSPAKVTARCARAKALCSVL